MAQKSTLIPLKVLLSYLLIAALVISVGYLLFQENKLFSTNENQTVEENQKLIRLGSLISKIYDVDNLGRVAIQTNFEEDFELYLTKNQDLIQEIDSFEQSITNQKQVVLLDSLKIILDEKVSNINELKETNKSQKTNSPLEKALQDLTRIEESMGKITVDGLNLDQSKLTSYERKVYQDLVDYLNDNVPKDSTNILTERQIDSILISSKRVLEDVQSNNQQQAEILQMKELALIRNDLYISQKLNEILVEFESDVIEKSNLNTISREKTQQRTVSILTIASIVGLVMTGLFFLLITNDFLKNQRYRKQLEKEKKKTESLLSAREQLIATVSHDLKTPLNTIQGFSELIAIGGISEKQNYYLSNIKSSSVYINQLVNDLLDFTKIEAGKIVLENTTFQLNKLITEVGESIETLHQSKAISLQLNLENTKGLWIENDILRIRQVLSNLIGNAFKFTEKGFVKITTTNHNNTITIAVEDSGIGIDQSKLNIIFNEFTQADKTIEKKYGGTGLGLTICKKLAQILNGNLTVNSQLNKGSEFIFSFPATIVEQENNPTEVFPENTKTFQIAIVDDDLSLLQLTATFLKMHNFEVAQFSQPNDLIASLETAKYDVIITDIQMPTMSGFELVKQIPTQIPVIAITGKSESGKAIYAESGFAGVLFKPYQSDDLLNLLGTILKVNFPKINQPETQISTENKEYNLQKLNAMLDNDQDAVREVLHIFVKDTKTNLTTIQEAIKSNDMAQISAISHRMKPMMNQLNVKEVVPLLQQLEDTNHSLSIEEIKVIFKKIKEKSTQVLTLIEKKLIL